MKITLLGNCQTKALSWYIQQLDASFDVKWICIDTFYKSNWALTKNFKGKDIEIIFDKNESIERLKNSDYIIFQHVKPSKSKYFHSEIIKKYQSYAELISISSFYYEPEDPQEISFKGMIDRAKKLNINIPAHKIIEKYRVDDIVTIHPYHPKSLYFLELLRQICEKTGWNYYSDKQYNQYLKQGYPFG